MMNELADRVDAELVEFEKVVDRLLFTTRIAKTQEYEELASLLIECRREVIKALRFAADMERLVSAGEDPVFVLGHNCVWIDGYSVAEQGPDIYTVARRAVEALKKGD